MRRARRSGSAAGRRRSARKRRRSRSTSSASAPASRPSSRRSSRTSGCSRRTAAAATKRYPESDADVAATCAQLARYGVAPRHLRTFRTATGREAALLEQLVAPALRGRNPERRAQALRDLQQLAELAQRALVAALLARPARLGAVTRSISMSKVREVQDFPTPGVGFKDITPLLADPAALRQTVGELADWVRTKDAGSRARRRGARLLARLGDRRRGGLSASSLRGGPASCRRRPSARATSSSTARTRSSCIPT